VSLLDLLRPVKAPRPKDARVVSFGGWERPVDVTERSKEAQRKHWRENDRRKK